MSFRLAFIGRLASAFSGFAATVELKGPEI
jgi:hypothetical protein